jgi:uncharacterized protein with ParB-like and HNH nuclease domain
MANSLEERIRDLERALLTDSPLSREELRKWFLMMTEERGAGQVEEGPKFTEEDWKWYREVSENILKMDSQPIDLQKKGKRE